MNDFWKSYDITALEYGVNYQCYPLYGRIHLTELALSLIFNPECCALVQAQRAKTAAAHPGGGHGASAS